MKLLQINTVANSGSTGRIAEEIGKVVLNQGGESIMAYGRGNPTSSSKLYQIGSQLDTYRHGAHTMLTGKHGFASKEATKDLIREIEKWKPDVIGLHNLHGYYINIQLLFNFIRESNIPTLWTLFDCWAFTGHCTYFDDINCEKWVKQCHTCPKTGNYPKSLWVDNSKWNFATKKALFSGLNNLEIIVHSNWLHDLVKRSYLGDYQVHVSPSAINLNLFKPTENSHLYKTYNLGVKKILLGCASSWTNRKGFKDFLELSKDISKHYQLVMIGLNAKELQQLPSNIIGLSRTNSIEELAAWYSLAEVFLNLTTQDNFPTTNLEALACGTPVITYDTGGSPEAIDESTGIVIPKGSVQAIIPAVERLEKLDKEVLQQSCRDRAVKLFNAETRYLDYHNIYNSLLS